MRGSEAIFLLPEPPLQKVVARRPQLESETSVTGVDGKLIKGNLAKVFVVGKGDGWGQDVPEQLRNGARVFLA